MAKGQATPRTPKPSPTYTGKGLVKVEKEQQIEAFEYYYALGEERSHLKVAEHFGKSERTIIEWSRSFGWLERISQRNIEVANKLREKSIKTVVDEKAKYRTIVKTAIGKFVKNLTEDKIDVKSVYELRELIKLDLMLMGEPTEIQKVQNEVTEEDREAVKELVEAMKSQREALVEDEEEE